MFTIGGRVFVGGNVEQNLWFQSRAADSIPARGSFLVKSKIVYNLPIEISIYETLQLSVLLSEMSKNLNFTTLGVLIMNLL
jgi:hypothetical protein